MISSNCLAYTVTRYLFTQVQFLDFWGSSIRKACDLFALCFAPNIHRCFGSLLSLEGMDACYLLLPYQATQTHLLLGS